MGSLINQLPTPPINKIGWPWNDESIRLPPLIQNREFWPKISIITPSFNQGHFIEETIRSVLLQNYPNLEYIIIDGGSTDNSVEIIKKYESWLTYWISEKDKGQSHAINKGLERCTGDIIAWLNSDDLFTKNALWYVADNLAIDKPSWLIGSSFIVDHRRNLIKVRNAPHTVNQHTFLLWLENWFPQQSTFWNKRLFHTSGYLDVSLHYVMDVDFWWRLHMHSKPLIVNETLSEYRIQGAAKTIHLNNESNTELYHWIYNKLILCSNESYSNFSIVLDEILKLNRKLNRLREHNIIGKFIRLWGAYINRNLGDI